MAQGPDPNRWTPRDPETTRGQMGDPPSTRLGLSSGAIALIVVLIAAVAAALMWFGD